MRFTCDGLGNHVLLLIYCTIAIYRTSGTSFFFSSIAKKLFHQWQIPIRPIHRPPMTEQRMQDDDLLESSMPWNVKIPRRFPPSFIRCEFPHVDFTLLEDYCRGQYRFKRQEGVLRDERDQLETELEESRKQAVKEEESSSKEAVAKQSSSKEAGEEMTDTRRNPTGDTTIIPTEDTTNPTEDTTKDTTTNPAHDATSTTPVPSKTEEPLPLTRVKIVESKFPLMLYLESCIEEYLFCVERRTWTGRKKKKARKMAKKKEGAVPVVPSVAEGATGSEAGALTGVESCVENVESCVRQNVESLSVVARTTSNQSAVPGSEMIHPVASEKTANVGDGAVPLSAVAEGAVPASSTVPAAMASAGALTSSSGAASSGAPAGLITIAPPLPNPEEPVEKKDEPPSGVSKLAVVNALKTLAEQRVVENAFASPKLSDDGDIFESAESMEEVPAESEESSTTYYSSACSSRSGSKDHQTTPPPAHLDAASVSSVPPAAPAAAFLLPRREESSDLSNVLFSSQPPTSAVPLDVVDLPTQEMVFEGQRTISSVRVGVEGGTTQRPPDGSPKRGREVQSEESMSKKNSGFFDETGSSPEPKRRAVCRGPKEQEEGPQTFSAATDEGAPVPMSVDSTPVPTSATERLLVGEGGADCWSEKAQEVPARLLVGEGAGGYPREVFPPAEQWYHSDQHCAEPEKAVGSERKLLSPLQESAERNRRSMQELLESRPGKMEQFEAALWAAATELVGVKMEQFEAALWAAAAELVG